MAKKVLFINQEIDPYVAESHMSIMGRELPQKMQEAGFEIRTFMPKWGTINERRGQLHEVIRLSGMVEITDITLYESIVRLVLDVLEVSQVTSVSQLVEVDDVILRIFVHEKSYYV